VAARRRSCRNLPFRVCAGLAAGILAAAAAAARAESRADEVLRFADHLSAQGECYRAITEYERFIFLAPEDERVPYARLREALAHLDGEEYERAFEGLEALNAAKEPPDIARIAGQRLAGGLYDRGRYQDALAIVSRLPKEDGGALNVFQALCYLHLGRPELARTACARTSETNMTERVRRAAEAYDRLPRKSPALAGVMSAVLPGAGQLYARRPHDAAWAFALTGVSAGACAYAFKSDEPVAGIAAGLIALVWYSGNVYNCNQAAGEAFFDRVEQQTLRDTDGPLFRIFLSHSF